MNKKATWVQIVLFLGFIAVFMLLFIFSPNKTFSERENRVLQASPKFSFSSLFSGKYISEFEDYVTDQFPFRDSWVTLKARSEILSGRDENNGIYLCDDGALIEPFVSPALSEVDFKLAAIGRLLENTEIPVYFALVPSASEIWSFKLPADAPNDSQKELIDYAYSETGCYNIDIYSELYEHKNEEIYYRTDHHWTTLGAYYAYVAIMEELGLDYNALSDYTQRVVSESFYGTTYSSSGFSWVSPDSISVYADDFGVTVTNYPKGAAETGLMYDESALDTKDKYAYFFGGNTPLLIIQTENLAAPSLLIIRDSYMDSLTPFLAPHFSEIHIIDLRYYKLSLAQYIKDADISNILICYNVKNFVEDENVFLVSQ